MSESQTVQRGVGEWHSSHMWRRSTLSLSLLHATKHTSSQKIETYTHEYARAHTRTQAKRHTRSNAQTHTRTLTMVRKIKVCPMALHRLNTIRYGIIMGFSAQKSTPDKPCPVKSITVHVRMCVWLWVSEWVVCMVVGMCFIAYSKKFVVKNQRNTDR